MAKRSVCRFWLAGRCTRGDKCRFRHEGEGVTARDVEAGKDATTGPKAPNGGAEDLNEEAAAVDDDFGEGFRLVPDLSGAYTMLVDNCTKVTVTAGLEPAKIKSLGTRESPIRIDFVASALEGDARRALSALHGKSLFGVNLVCQLGYKGGWSVKVSNVTRSSEENDLLHLLPPNVPRPLECRFGKFTYDLSIDPLDVIKRKIGEATSCAIKGTQMLYKKNPLKCKALFEVKGAPNLRAIARDLDQQSVADLGNSKIFVVERQQSQFSISRSTFGGHEREIKSLARDLAHEQNVISMRIDDNSPGPVKVSMAGSSRDEMTAAIASVYRLIASDLRNGFARLQVDITNAHLHHVPLDGPQILHLALNGGFAHVQQLFGEQTVQIDPQSSPPTLIVHGDTVLLSKVKQAVTPAPATCDKHTECSICWDDIEEDVVVVDACGHVCCKDCFHNYCTVDRPDRFPLKCFTQDCDELMPVQLLRSNLDEAEIVRILQQAVRDHQEHHPADYTPCSGPDCNLYYNREDVGEQHLCPICFTISCTHCKSQQHFGESCAQYEERISGYVQALEEWAQENNAKRCKACNTLCEKIEGCNNMECPGCKARFCWQCLYIGADRQDVYTHMLDAHGTYGDPEIMDEIARRFGPVDALLQAQDQLINLLDDGAQVDVGNGMQPLDGVMAALNLHDARPNA